MKGFILVFFLFLQEAQAACLSGSLVPSLHKNLDVRYAEDVVLDFEQVIREDLPSQYSLVINLEPLNPRINAEIKKEDDHLRINLMGGILGHERMNDEALKLLLCHEIGHFLGGPPYKSRTGWSSTEGQADYYSAFFCARKFSFTDEAFIEAALALTSIYAGVTMSQSPRLETCEETRVGRTNYGYPSVQCRLDTLIAGWRKMPRPACWFYAEIEKPVKR